MTDVMLPPVTATQLEALLTPREVAKILGVSTSALSRWRSKPGRGPAYVLLGDASPRYRASDVAEFIAARTVR